MRNRFLLFVLGLTVGALVGWAGQGGFTCDGFLQTAFEPPIISLQCYPN